MHLYLQIIIYKEGLNTGESKGNMGMTDYIYCTKLEWQIIIKGTIEKP